MTSFKNHIENSTLSKTTKAGHIRYITAVQDYLHDIDAMKTYLSEQFTLNKQFQICKTLSKYFEYHTHDDYRSNILEFAADVKSRLQVTQQKKTREIKIKIENNEMKDIHELKTALEKLYDDSDYKRFVINYLLIHYHTRNLDLDLTVATSRKYINTTDNFLLIRRYKVEFIRSNYKTAKQYQTIEFTITDPTFVYACRKLELGKLLHTKNIGQEIKGLTIDNLSETQINKIVMYSLPANKLEHMSKSRGTSVQTLLDSYNPNRV